MERCEPERARVVGALCEVLVAPEDPGRIVAALAAPDVQIVTLTIPEKGYHLGPATGQLDLEAPDVAADLRSLLQPRTAAGLIVAGLARRRASGLGAFTVVSCDDLPRNGVRLRGAVLATADARDPALARWIEAEASFPQTMVDRIVPALTEGEATALRARWGVEDHATFATEPFFQWVVEDRFVAARPDFKAFGVQLASNVAPWEEAKLRLLNGAHSVIAYLGGLANVEHVDAFVATADRRAYIEALWDEAAETLSSHVGWTLPAIAAS